MKEEAFYYDRNKIWVSYWPHFSTPIPSALFFPKQGCATSHFLNQDPCMDRLHLVRYIAVFLDLLLELSHLTTPSPPCAADAEAVAAA